MTNILVCDVEAEAIEKIASDNDIRAFEVIELLMDYVDDMKRDNGLI